MSRTMPARYPRWWGGSLLDTQRPRSWVVGQAARAASLAHSRDALIAAVAARAWRWAAHGLERLGRQPEPRDTQELLAYAQTLERSMPNLAAELRCLACKEG